MSSEAATWYWPASSGRWVVANENERGAGAPVWAAAPEAGVGGAGRGRRPEGEAATDQAEHGSAGEGVAQSAHAPGGESSHAGSFDQGETRIDSELGKATLT